MVLSCLTRTPKVLPLESMLIWATNDQFIQFAAEKNGSSYVLCSGMEENSPWNLQIEQRGIRFTPRSCKIKIAKMRYGDENDLYILVVGDMKIGFKSGQTM